MKPWNLANVITPVNTKYGAPMGRASIGIEPDSDVKIYVKKVNLIDGGYDKGGVYWGYPNNIYVRFSKDHSFVEFYRKEN